jgi:formylglycine-generating enzyme required for sulfatase activity
MSAAVENYRDEMSVSYAVDFNRDREPTQKRSRFPDYRRKGSAPARVSGMHCRRNKKWTWGSGRGARTLNARAFASSVAFALVSLAATAFGVTIDYTPVNNAGNAANVSTGWGAVSNVFKIAKYETSNEQYKDFLNKVDASGTNPNGVYNAQMGSDSLGGITFNAGGSSGAKYTVKTGTSPGGVAYTNMPVLFTTWFSAARFTNWLQNGQQTNSSSMETGAYTLNNQTSGNIPARNAGATDFLPSRDEWYKAGFYDGNTVAYKTWPTDSNAQPTNTVSNLTLANVANYGSTSTPTLSPISVGSYINTTSPYGAFDMFGNATEYTDTAGTGADVGRPQMFSGSWATTVASAGCWNSTASAIFRSSTTATGQVGFRVAAVPEPATIALASVGIASLAGLDWMKRRKKKATAARLLA